MRMSASKMRKKARNPDCDSRVNIERIRRAPSLKSYSFNRKSTRDRPIISKAFPPPRATQVSGSSAITTGKPVSSIDKLLPLLRPSHVLRYQMQAQVALAQGLHELRPEYPIGVLARLPVFHYC